MPLTPEQRAREKIDALLTAARGMLVILLLCGGDKGTQVKDIARAKRMVQAVKE
jgi:putative component of toxin-antitoxin plasmid stabilization module